MNQIDNIKSFTSDMRFDVVGLTCRMKSVLITAMFNIGTGGAIPVVAPKGTGGGSGVTGVGAVSSSINAQCSIKLWIDILNHK